MRFWARYTLATVWSVASAITARGQPVTFHGLGHLPGPTGAELVSLVHGISGDGSTVVGESRATGVAGGFVAGFKWTQATGMQAVTSAAPGSIGDAYGASFDGSTIVGSSSTLPRVGYPWTQASGLVPLDATRFSNPTATTWDGNTIVGISGSEAFRWTAATGIVGLGFLPGTTSSFAQAVSPDGGTIVGWSGNSPNAAFRWTESSGMQALGSSPGWSRTEARALSIDGQIAGGCAEMPGQARAIVWNAAGAPTDLGPGRIYACSADGTLFGGTGSGVAQAFLWDANGAKLVTSILGSVLPPGWGLHSVEAISADGRTIAGIGGNPQGLVEAWVATIPAPAGALLLLGLVGCARRRARP